MKQFKKAQVIMLPTKNIKNSIWLDEKNYLLLNHFLIKQKPKGKFQHLYIISDDEIKESDWCLDTINNILFISDGNIKLHKFTDKKIIATTDNSLKLFSGELDLGVSLPQPSQEFIEKYVECYNRGEIITNILVEYELQSYSNRFEDKKPIGDSETWGKRLSLKINPKDNTIIIKQEKETLKDIMMKNPDIRGEVVQLLNEIITQSKEQYSLLDRLGLDKWIEENL